MYGLRSERQRAAGVAIGLGLAAAALAACSRPVAVPIPSPGSPQVTAACDALIAALPGTLVGEPRREVDPPNTLTAAWGMTPPLTLRCGVPTPAALTPSSRLLTVDGVDWLPEQRSAGYVYTTVGRAANVEVAVADDYAPHARALAELSPTVAAKNPVAGQ